MDCMISMGRFPVNFKFVFLLLLKIVMSKQLRLLHFFISIINFKERCILFRCCLNSYDCLWFHQIGKWCRQNLIYSISIFSVPIFLFCWITQNNWIKLKLIRLIELSVFNCFCCNLIPNKTKKIVIFKISSEHFWSNLEKKTVDHKELNKLYWSPSLIESWFLVVGPGDFIHILEKTQMYQIFFM